MSIKKIVILGPESTGKSSLCCELAEHYNTLWVPEYAREYLLTNGNKYTLKDLWTIAEGQLRSEDEFTQMKNETTKKLRHPAKSFLFIDTDMHVMKTWSEFVFDACDNRILKKIADRQYDLYLLCNTDLPWQKDELREYPDLASREKLFEHYREAMINQAVPWVVISGNYRERKDAAIRAVDTLIKM